MKGKSHESLLLPYQHSFCTPFAASALFLTLCPAGAWSRGCSQGHRKLHLEHHDPQSPPTHCRHTITWGCGHVAPMAWEVWTGVGDGGRFFWFLNLLFP